MGMTRFNTKLLLFMTLLLILSGCVDRTQLKADLHDAVRKHGEIRDYRFSGTLELAERTPSTANGPAAGILSLPPEATFTWQGVASYDPLRVEADIRITTPDKDPIVVPLVIQHNKMAFRLPGVQPEDRYLSVDLTQLAERHANGDWPELAESGVWFATLLGTFIENISPERFDEPDDRLDFRRITATFNEKQADEFTAFWQSAWPAVQAVLSGSGLPAAQTTPDAFTLHEPVRFTFDLNDEGYVEQLRAEADLSWQRDNGESGSRLVHFVHRNDDINAGQTFARDMPEETIPFDELLKWLPQAAGDGGPEN